MDEQHKCAKVASHEISARAILTENKLAAGHKRSATLADGAELLCPSCGLLLSASDAIPAPAINLNATSGTISGLMQTLSRMPGALRTIRTAAVAGGFNPNDTSCSSIMGSTLGSPRLNAPVLQHMEESQRVLSAAVQRLQNLIQKASSPSTSAAAGTAAPPPPPLLPPSLLSALPPTFLQQAGSLPRAAHLGMSMTSRLAATTGVQPMPEVAEHSEDDGEDDDSLMQQLPKPCGSFGTAAASASQNSASQQPCATAATEPPAAEEDSGEGEADEEQMEEDSQAAWDMERFCLQQAVLQLEMELSEAVQALHSQQSLGQQLQEVVAQLEISHTELQARSIANESKLLASQCAADGNRSASQLADAATSKPLTSSATGASTSSDVASSFNLLQHEHSRLIGQLKQVLEQQQGHEAVIASLTALHTEHAALQAQHAFLLEQQKREEEEAARFNALQGGHAALHAQHAQVLAQHKELDEQQQKRNGEVVATVTAVKAEHAALQARMEAQQKESEGQKRRYEALVHSLGMLQGEHAALLEKHARMLGQHKDLESQFNQLQQQHTALVEAGASRAPANRLQSTNLNSTTSTIGWPEGMNSLVLNSTGTLRGNKKLNLALLNMLAGDANASLTLPRGAPVVYNAQSEHLASDGFGATTRPGGGVHQGLAAFDDDANASLTLPRSGTTRAYNRSKSQKSMMIMDNELAMATQQRAEPSRALNRCKTECTREAQPAGSGGVGGGCDGDSPEGSERSSAVWNLPKPAWMSGGGGARFGAPKALLASNAEDDKSNQSIRAVGPAPAIKVLANPLANTMTQD